MNGFISKEKLLTDIDFENFYRTELPISDTTLNRSKIITICPFHHDTKPSLSIDLITGNFKCFGSCSEPKHGSIFDFYMKLHNCSFPDAFRALEATVSGGESIYMLPSKDPAHVYTYRDMNSNILYQVCKYSGNKKKFLQRRPDGNGGWIWNLKGIKTVLYNLPRLKDSKSVFIVEGEKDADRLNKAGLTSTCNPMGEGKWRDHYNESLEGKDVFIIPDNDLVGIKHAESVATSINGVAKSTRLVALPGLQNKEDVSDWLDAGHKIKDLIDLVKDTPVWKPKNTVFDVIQEVTQKNKLDIDKRLWPKLNPEALEGLAGEIVSLATENSEADPAAILMTFLVRFGVEAGTFAYFRTGHSVHYPRLYATIIGKSAKARKGTSSTIVKDLFKFSQFAEYETANSVNGPLSTGEGLIHAVRDKTTNAKGSVDDEGVKDKRLFILEEEFGVTFKVSAREGNTLSQTLRMLWDEGYAAPLTKTSQTRTTNAHIGIVAHITHDELKTLISAVDIHNGFASRFLWVCVKRSKLVPRPKPISAENMYNIQRKLLEILRINKKNKEYTFTKAAWSLWDYNYSDLSEEVYGAIGSITARCEVQVLRIALIYAILDGMDAIDVRHLKSALAVWDYCNASAKYVFGKDSLEPDPTDPTRSVRSTYPERIVI